MPNYLEDIISGLKGRIDRLESSLSAFNRGSMKVDSLGGDWAIGKALIAAPGNKISFASFSGFRAVCFSVFGSDEDVYVSDGLSFFVVPSAITGVSIVSVIAGVFTKGVSGTSSIQIRKRRDNVDLEVLSTPLTIGDEYYSENCTINSLTSACQTGDKLFVDVESIHSGASPKGLSITIVFQ